MTDDAQTIFDENILGTLATINEDGSPWATPLHILTDKEAVYWFSHESTVHSANIARDARASLALFSPDESKGPKGVYINGRVEMLDGEDRAVAHALFEQRLGAVPAFFETARAYRLPLGTFDPSKSKRNCWYFYT